MNKYLILSFLIPFFGSAQITVTSTDFGSAGDTVRMSTTTDLAIDFATTGANQTWDYSTLVPESQYLIEYSDMSNASALVNIVFGFFAPPQYQATYFMPNDDLPFDQVGSFLPVPISDVFQFSKKSADSITSVGFALNVDGNEVPFKSDTIETRYKFPLNYTDTYSSRGYTSMDLNPISDFIWLQYRQRDTEVDGWGSITTPYGTFDALRLKHVITETDSIRMDVFGGPMWIEIPIPDSYIYEWWTNGEKEPILRIETNDVFGNEVVSNIEYRDFYRGLDAGIEEQDVTINVYPNPASDVVTVSGLDTDAEYFVLDLQGKTVLNGTLSNEIDVRSLEPGVYKLVVKTTNGRGTSTFIKH